MAQSERGIGLLGGSFNPVHNGHLAIAESFLASKYISELWILLTPDPPHKNEKSLNDYRYRLAMLRAAFKQYDRVKISDIENQLSRPSYTIQTLQYLTDKYPETNFYLCLGEDSLRDFKQWKDWQKILDHCELLVARRYSDNAPKLDPRIASRTHFVDHQPVELSSTMVREWVSKGNNISHLVPQEVRAIIEKEHLYKS